MDAERALERYGSQMRATARYYSANAFDAEDAYQRTAELLVARSPDRSGDDLCRWLRTTVKHEALAIRAHHERVVCSGPAETLPETGPNPADTEVAAERLDRLRSAGQALRSLKPHEARCLTLRIEGYSYAEIRTATGFTYRKVDRCVTEGRAALRQGVVELTARPAAPPAGPRARAA